MKGMTVVFPCLLFHAVEVEGLLGNNSVTHILFAIK